MMEERAHSSYSILFIIGILFISLIGFLIINKPSITGLITYEEATSTKNWTFEDPNDYVYDNSSIDIGNGDAKLVSTTTYTYWNTTSEVVYTVNQAIYDGEDQTSKVTTVGDESIVKVNKNNIFDVTFSSSIQNGDTINFYLTTDPSTTSTDIYLCGANTNCTSPGYGMVNFDNTEGWYSIEVSGLSSPTDTLNIDPGIVNFDYINATHLDITENNLSNTSYPTSASIETKDVTIASLFSYLNFYSNDILNSQTIDYSYSTDSGTSWTAIPSKNNLSGLTVGSGKIRIKAEITADGTDTPNIYDLSVSYSTQSCNENWNLTYGICSTNDQKLKYYVDKNDCGTINNIPSENGTFVSCDYCVPSWECTNYGQCLITNNKLCTNAIDNKNCFNATASNSDKYSDDYTEFNQSCIYSKIGDNFQNLSISLVANEKTIFNTTNSTDTILEFVSNININNKLISITRYNENLKNTSPKSSALGKYLDIDADKEISENLESIKIKIYYTENEVNNANLDENTLKIHYFNESSSQWQLLNSTVNTTENYIEVTLDHLSTFGIFGDPPTPPSSPRRSSSGGGGSNRLKKSVADSSQNVLKTPIAIQESLDKETIENSNKAICKYEISVSLPEHISLVESEHIKGIVSNIGNCDIESFKIKLDKNLAEIIKINKDIIGYANVNESIEFLIIKKLDSNNVGGLHIQGFNINIPKSDVETYTGTLTFNGLVNNKLAVEETFNIKIDVKTTSQTSTPFKSSIIIYSSIFLFICVVFYGFYRKIKKKDQIQF